MNIQGTSTELLTPSQLRKLEQRKRIATEFVRLKGQYEAKGENPSDESLCRRLSDKYQKSVLTIRRYLQAQNII
jgi:hypothetical protein